MHTAQDNLDNMETKSYIDIDVDLSDPVEGKPRGKPFHEILSPLVKNKVLNQKPQLHQLKLNHLPSRKLLHHLLQIMQPWIQHHLESSSVNPELTFEFSSETSLIKALFYQSLITVVKVSTCSEILSCCQQT